MKLVDGIADLNSGLENAAKSKKIIVGILKGQRLTFTAAKCKILKINSCDFSNTVSVKGEEKNVDTQLKYLRVS